MFPENLIFFIFATFFFVFVGWVWRNSKPFSIPHQLPNWFKIWFVILTFTTIVLPLAAMMLWGVWWGHNFVLALFTSYFLMLLSENLSKVIAIRFKSCVWIIIPCLYVPFRIWQLYKGLNLISPEPELLWVRKLLILNIILWTLTYAIQLAQIPRMLQWDLKR